MFKPGTLIRVKATGETGIILRWPSELNPNPPDQEDWDEWVVLLFNSKTTTADPEMCCAGDMDELGVFPEFT